MHCWEFDRSSILYHARAALSISFMPGGLALSRSRTIHSSRSRGIWIGQDVWGRTSRLVYLLGCFFLIGTASVIYILLMGYWVEYWLAMIWTWKGQWRDMPKMALRSAGTAHRWESLLWEGRRGAGGSVSPLSLLLSFSSFPPPSSSSCCLCLVPTLPCTFSLSCHVCSVISLVDFHTHSANCTIYYLLLDTEYFIPLESTFFVLRWP
ncbi:uncharacterized protein BO80DRAFT_40693 [Aspergillus ibericus CBS 121593]|uniref:Uncharacterized protein n=1 Tax=Aspergillus ibericus CBS 121593 TaxID=1448316 RepID=A0A395H5G7_9EURO|nr:hypothetical protein BO80DRAFT_40693 [Aspergillus ibericus CBS 121593]RAL02148.1 hypothetical protein BO80DRAFT_40693 [Aspergillus ibericus CBS 121593]